MRDVAIDYGWPSGNVVIFQDERKPGDTTEDREAYTRMVQEIAARRVGAVLFVDATRVTRSASDWLKFCSLCEAADTLLISELGVYDLRNLEDKLFLSSSDVTTELDLTVTHKRLRE
jgi:DNA invertase Pin-like site-specific DNA recombinase